MTASRGLVGTKSASALVLALWSCQAGTHPAVRKAGAIKVQTVPAKARAAGCP